MDLIKSIKEKRSINFFEPGVEISENILQELLSLANLAPSSFNLQPWRVIVVKNRERKKEQLGRTWKNLPLLILTPNNLKPIWAYKFFLAFIL